MSEIQVCGGLAGAVATTEIATRAEATERAERIRDGLVSVASTITDIKAAWHARDWKALGYESWNAYVVGEFGEHRLPRLSRDLRRDLVAQLHEGAMSTRSIASVLGVAQDTVNRDLAAGERNRSPDGESSDQPKITGTDGRSYPASRSTPPSREPEPESDDEPILYGEADADDFTFEVRRALADFPELDYYVSAGQAKKAVGLADNLRKFAEPELSMRRDNLRKAIEADRRRADEPDEPAGPDYYALADEMFVALNRAAQTVSRNGGADTFAEAIGAADPLMVTTWHDQFIDLSRTCSALADACRPRLRRIK